MKVTVCELRNDPAGLDRDWLALIEHVTSEKSDLVLLPEMTFHPWLALSGGVIWVIAFTSSDQVSATEVDPLDLSRS